MVSLELIVRDALAGAVAAMVDQMFMDWYVRVINKRAETECAVLGPMLQVLTEQGGAGVR